MAMSMRQRGGRSNIPNQLRPPRLAAAGRLYEQFKPMSEWRQEDDHHTLLVYLPGFQKDYIKVTTEELNIVRVRGARQIEGNRWSRFQEDYRVPENCEMTGIRARFDGGILTVTMPTRKILNTNATPPPTTATTQAAAPKTKQQPFTGIKQDPNTTKQEPKEKKHAADKPAQTITTPNLEGEANTTNLPPPHNKASSSSTQAEPYIKPTRRPETKDDVVQFPKSAPPPPPKKDNKQADVVEKASSVGKKTDLDKGKGKLEALVKEDTKKRDLDEQGSSSKGRKQYNYEGQVISGSSTAGDQAGAGENKKVAARRGGILQVMMNDDRKALVNVGVGILVIVALGVHVSYTIGLIGGKGN